jgi:uncharacterized membrane protein
MSNAWVVGVLTYAHVLSAIGWLGAVLTMNLAIAPLLNRFAPSTRLDILGLFLPRFSRLTAIFSGLTVLTGAGLYSQIYSQNDAGWFPVIGIGILLALIAFFDGVLLLAPLTKRVSGMANAMGSQPAAPPSPEFLSTVRKLQVSAIASMFLLLATLAFMVAAGQV